MRVRMWSPAGSMKTWVFPFRRRNDFECVMRSRSRWNGVRTPALLLGRLAATRLVGGHGQRRQGVALALPDGGREAIGDGTGWLGHVVECRRSPGEPAAALPLPCDGEEGRRGRASDRRAGSSPAAARKLATKGPFAYDASQPLAFDDLGVVDPDYPVAVHDVSYGSGDDRVEAFLVVPPGDGPWPAAVYVHGAGSDRLSMLGPATWLAARGAVTLAISAPSGSAGEPEGATGLARLEAHRDLEVGDVVAVRRAVDLLSERDDVDPDRIGYVGWSAGARTGSILAGRRAATPCARARRPGCRARRGVRRRRPRRGQGRPWSR